MRLTAPRDIYKEVHKEMGAILDALGKQPESMELSKAVETARNNFMHLKGEADAVLDELDKNAEWEALTIALYGETNAGKSTIIETLRILMGEKTKREQQQKFRQVCEKFNIDENTAKIWKEKKQKIVQYEKNLESIVSRFYESQAKHETLKNKIIFHAEQLAVQIKALPLWRIILSFVWKIPEKTALNAANKELDTMVGEAHRLSQEYEQKKLVIIEEINSEKKEVAGIDIAVEELKIHEDGAIIGDGQSDFTRKLTSYEFDVNGNKLVLLDVPGIEGKEEEVREPIMQAVRKAHAVFYVTRKADPPQKGDEKTGRKGTLEKIKEHLGAQTEVWTIFNKSIQSVEQLQRPLINEGEYDGLVVLEKEMRKQLNEHYAGSFNVSAYPAFVASTSNFLPDSMKSKHRIKFLSIMSADDILQRSGVQSLADKIVSDMAESASIKIHKSNFNKANDTVIKLKKGVCRLNKKIFKPLHDKLKNQADNSILQLDSAIKSLEGRIKSNVELLLSKKQRCVTEKIRKKIDGEVVMNNNEFKKSLDDSIKSEMDNIKKEMPDEIERQIKVFQKEAEGMVEQFREHVQEFLDDASMKTDVDLDPDIEIDNGIDLPRLIAAVVAAAALFFSGAGGVVAVLAAVGAFVSAYKSVRSFFSNDYKKSRQREMADKKIAKEFRSIESQYNKMIEGNIKKLEKKFTDVKHNFELPKRQAEQIISSLGDSIDRLEVISREIIKEGNLQ